MGQGLEWGAQGSVLGPVLFLIYINDIVLGTDSSIKLFADDAKIFRGIKNLSDVASLQADLDLLADWSRDWLLKFNSTKCSAMHFGHSNLHSVYNLNDGHLDSSDEERDLGVLVSSSFKFGNHVSKIASKANSIVGRIKRTFTFMDKDV